MLRDFMYNLGVGETFQSLLSPECVKKKTPNLATQKNKYFSSKRSHKQSQQRVSRFEEMPRVHIDSVLKNWTRQAIQ